MRLLDRDDQDTGQRGKPPKREGAHVDAVGVDPESPAVVLSTWVARITRPALVRVRKSRARGRTAQAARMTKSL